MTAPKKTVKGWAILNEKQTAIKHVYLNRSVAKGEARGICWCGCLNREVVPCTITYSLPKPTTRKKKNKI
jgi:hypothetical protein